MSSVFPEFVSEEGSDELILANPENYKNHPSGIQYEDIFSGIKGPLLTSEKQKVTIRYQLFAQNAKCIGKEHFKNTLKEFAEELNFDKDFTDAILKMKFCGLRRFIIPPKINNTKEYRIVELLLQNIKPENDSDEVSSKEKPKKAKQVEEEPKEMSNLKVVLENSSIEKAKQVEEEPKEITNPKVVPDNNFVNAGDNLIAHIKSISVAVGVIGAAAASVTGLVQQIKIAFPKLDGMSRDSKPLLPKVRFDEEIMYPAQNTYINEIQPKQWAGVDPKVTYNVIDQGDGKVMSAFRQGCFFQYKEGGSMEAISFEGSAIELAGKLGPGFEEAMLEAIVGMKVNGRRLIIIPREVSGLTENTFIELKLTGIRDFNARSRI